MVKQEHPTKTSSGGAAPKVRLGPAYLYFSDWLPRDVVISGESDQVILGTLPEVRTHHVSGRPHIALANLPTFDSNMSMKTGAEPSLRLDTEAAMKFVKDYGALYTKDLPHDPEHVALETGDNLFFREPISDFAAAQLELRKAWAGNLGAYFKMQQGLEYGTFLKFPNRGLHAILDRAYPGKRLESDENEENDDKYGVCVETKDLWTFIRLLFLADSSEDRIAVCANPNCVVPYFVKKRTTQKLCEQGECVVWAQRQYSLKWWNTDGRKRRNKEQEKRQNRNRKRNKQ